MGAEVDKVVVWPIGAMATLERSWQLTPAAEGFVAVMGPVHSGVLLAIAGVVQQILLKNGVTNPAGEYPLIDLLIRTNLYLCCVNLIPCLPLDGGRLLRSRMAVKLGYAEASDRLIKFGLWCGALLSLVGLLTLVAGRTVFLALVTGPVIFWGAVEERHDATAKKIMGLLTRAERLGQQNSIRVEEIMVSGDARVKDVVKKLRPSRYNVIVVAGKGMNVIGKVTEAKLLEAFYRGEVARPVRELCERPKGFL